MPGEAKEIDLFDRSYRDRVRETAWNAIIEAVRDPKTNMVLLRNYEIYDALLQLQAMILASSKQAGSTAEMHEISKDFAKRLRRHVAEFKNAYDRDGAPFEVIHTDQMQ